MDFLKVADCLNNLKKEPSSNAKIALLKEYFENPDFERVVLMALDPSRQYHIKNLDEIVPEKSLFRQKNFEDPLLILDALHEKGSATKADRQRLQKACEQSKAAWQIVSCIIRKNLDCGCGLQLAVKAKNDLIKKTPYMRCKTESKGLADLFARLNGAAAYLQEKMDGAFAYLIIDNGRLTALSRNGKIIRLHGVFDFLAAISDGIVLHGELVCRDKNEILQRQDGNGLVNKAVSGTLLPTEAAMFEYIAWDMTSIDEFNAGISNVPYKDRFSNLDKFLVAVNNSKIRLVSSVLCSSMEDAKIINNARIRSGMEGSVIKNPLGIWKSGTSKDMVKMKRSLVAEFRLCGVNFGDKNGKYADCVGSLDMTSEDGMISFSISSGLSDSDRGWPNDGQKAIDAWKNKINNVFSVEFDSLTQDKKTGSLSIFLPKNPILRLDRTIADFSNYIMEMCGK